MSITGDNQNVNINGNLVIPSLSNKIRTPLIQFFDNTTLNTANGIWSSNVSGGLLYNGNVTANYYMGNAATLTSLTGAASGAYGSANAIPTVNVDSTGRITSITSTPINTVATGTTGQIAFYNQSNVLGGSAGLGYTVGTQSLTVGGSLSVGGDLFITGNTYAGNNAVFNDTIVEIGNSYPNNTTLGILMQRPAGNVMLGYLTSEGGGSYANTLTFGYTFSSAAGSILVPDTNNTLPLHVIGSVTADTGFYGALKGSNTVTTSGLYGPVTGSNSISGSTISAGTALYGPISGSNAVTASTVSAGTAFYGTISGSNTVTASTVSATTLVGTISGSNSISGSSLSLGSNLSTSDTGSNVLTVNGNVSANYYSGNASKLTSLTGASTGTYGNATTVSQITVDATGRITGISNVNITQQATANLAQVVNVGNVTANTVQFTNATTSLTTSGNVSIGNEIVVLGSSNLIGNTVASNISVYSISFGGTSNGYVRSVSLQDATDVSNVTTAYVTAGGLSLTANNPVFLTSVTALGTWSGTPTPALGGASLAAFSATIGANITNFTPSGGKINGSYTIYAVSNGSYSISASVAGSVSNLSAPLSVTTGNRVLITITYDGTVYYVNWTKYS